MLGLTKHLVRMLSGALPVAVGAFLGHLLLRVGERALECLNVMTLGLADDLLQRARHGWSTLSAAERG